MAKVTSSGKF